MAWAASPSLADWYQVLQENLDTKHLAVVLARYVTGSAAAMGGRNEIDLDNKYIVIDTSGMPDDLLLPGIFWATDLANDLVLLSQQSCENVCHISLVLPESAEDFFHMRQKGLAYRALEPSVEVDMKAVYPFMEQSRKTDGSRVPALLKPQGFSAR